MSSFRVIGIDPALTATGLCVLRSVKPGDYRVTEYETIRTSEKKPMLARLETIREGVDGFLWGLVDDGSGVKPCDAIVIEDPTSRSGPAARALRGKSPRSIAVMSLAVGTVVCIAQEFLRFVPDHMTNRLDVPTLAFIDTDKWMPKTKSGNFEHMLARPQMARFLHSRITVPTGASEHVLMASGLARFWIERERLNERVQKGRSA